MQEAHVNGWARESHFSVEMLDSLRELNHRFLDLVGGQRADWRCGLRMGSSAAVGGHVAPLSAPQRKAAANCPYALFDLRFDDDAYWRARLSQDGRWCVADEPSMDENTRSFLHLALFFAWHLACAGRLAPQLMLGMNENTAAAFRAASIDRLPTLAAAAGEILAARWSDCSVYWSSLTGAAVRTNAAGLRRIQLYGIQLAAAARLS